MNACAAPIPFGPNKGKPATGSRTGYMRHHRAQDEPCDACRAANAEAGRQNRARNRKPKPAKPDPRRTQKVREAGYGPVPCWCSNCGSSGTANRALLIGRTHTIPQCSNCKGQTG